MQRWTWSSILLRAPGPHDVGLLCSRSPGGRGRVYARADRGGRRQPFAWPNLAIVASHSTTVSRHFIRRCCVDPVKDLAEMFPSVSQQDQWRHAAALAVAGNPSLAHTHPGHRRRLSPTRRSWRDSGPWPTTGLRRRVREPRGPPRRRLRSGSVDSGQTVTWTASSIVTSSGYTIQAGSSLKCCASSSSISACGRILSRDDAGARSSLRQGGAPAYSWPVTQG